MALLGTLINKFGKIAGWNSVKVVMLGRQVEGITALSYKDSKEKDNIYGAGEFPVGRGEGNYKAEASITLLKEEVTDNGVDVKQGDKSIATQFTLLPSHIDWNVAM